ncbi:rhomboid family intramembrane serine protease [Prolixibacteraceae bacterium JC049]|nr:rhomboid family intramembrane serine protease [Prolixibacteraceae bacterium JC049]
MRLLNYHPDNSTVSKEVDKKIFRYSLILPCVMVGLLWLIKLAEVTFDFQLTFLGVYPLHWKGVGGILTSPLIHSNFDHLIANSVPLFILSFSVIYFYRNLSYRIIGLTYIISGLMVWLGARPAWHIGASGVVYGLAAFLFFSGVLRNQIRLLTIAFIVVFLYGSMFWGIFPLKPDISWEGHLWGGVAGLILALFYRNSGPVRKKFQWEMEEEDEDDNEEDAYWMVDPKDENQPPQ